MNWRKWLDSGELKRLETGPEQAGRLLEAAEHQIRDARKILEIGVYPAARDQAYEAMLKTGMAWTMAHGYRPETGSHHLIAVRIVGELLGLRRRGLAKAFNDLRKTRHERLYDAVDACTKDEAVGALRRAEELHGHVEAVLGRKT